MKKVLGLLATLLMLLGSFYGIYSSLASQSTKTTTSTSAETSTDSTLNQQDALIEKQEQLFPQLETKLAEICQQQTGEIALSYLDLTTGYSFDINGDSDFLAASTSKVPLVMEMTDLINQGAYSGSDKIYYLESDFDDGGGVIEKAPEEWYTLDTLMEYAIVYSDNIATNMLGRVLGKDYRDYIYSTYLHATPRLAGNYLSANDTATILAYLYQNRTTPGYERIITNLKSTTVTNQLVTDKTRSFVAHKAGDYLGNVHDTGLFEYQRPYILTVFTYEVPEAEELISEISDLVFDTQAKLVEE